MNTITLHALSAAYQSKTLAGRISQFDTDTAAWRAANAAHENTRKTIMAREATHVLINRGAQQDNAVASWIGAGTFADGAAALVRATEMRRERFNLPIVGLRLLDELAAIRDEAQREWGAHVARLRAALEAAEAAARKEAEGFRGLSAAAKQAHVADKTAAEREAVAGTASNPTPPEWGGWESRHLSEIQEALLQELRAAFAAAVA